MQRCPSRGPRIDGTNLAQHIGDVGDRHNRSSAGSAGFMQLLRDRLFEVADDLDPVGIGAELRLGVLEIGAERVVPALVELKQRGR